MKKETIKRIRDFTIDRDWDQFHSPANLAKSISIEANELLECFQWDENNYDIHHVILCQYCVLKRAFPICLLLHLGRHLYGSWQYYLYK